MATYPLQGPPHAGAVLTTQSPGGTAGDLAPTGQGVGLWAACGTAPSTITAPITATYDGLAVASRTLALTAGQYGLLPLPDNVYGVGTTGINYSNIQTIQVAVIRIP